MRIVAIGLRGFPDVQGGIEKHCEHLYPRLVTLGCEVIVLSRSPYTGRKPYVFNGVKIEPHWSPRQKTLEAFLHTFVGTIIAKCHRPDIVHFHATGPSFFVPFAKILGMKVIATHHGFDYERAKWGRLAKLFIKQGERHLCKADQVIAVSEHIRESLAHRLHCEATFIPNGVELPQIVPGSQFCAKWGVSSGKYFLFMGRLVPEKCVHDLLDAFEKMKTEWKLVIAGDADHKDAYSRELKTRAKSVKNAIMTGFITGFELGELCSNAGCFVLPSSHEGLPIALLEALSFGLPCIVSDIPANRGITHPTVRYFPVHDSSALRVLMQETIDNPEPISRSDGRAYVAAKFNWDDVAERTMELMKRLM